MSADKMVPEIRFKGFSEDWEVREFGNDLVSVQTGTGLLAGSGNSGCPLIKMGNIQRGYFCFEKVERLSAKVEVEKENLANYGDFLFNTRNTLELVGKGATWMGKSNEFAFNNNIARFTLKGINTVFFNYLYNTQQMIKQVQARAMGTTSVAAIYPYNLKSIRYALPKVEEQTAIGNYFQKLDALINQHQKKHDKLSNIKKAMLEKMFPKQGETIPEIRFKGFSGDWEEVRVGEIAKTTIGEFVKQTKQNPNSPYPVFNGGKSFTGFYDEYNNEGDKILISARGANAGFVNYQKEMYWAGNSCYSIEVIDKSKYDTMFIFFSIKKLQHLFTDFQQAANIPSVSKADVEKFEIIVPYFEEQLKIGTYFKKLDALINQHQQQITKLNNIKQACLSKMFV